MSFYAQLLGDVVVAVSETHSEHDSPDMILLETFDESLLGHFYDRESGIFAAPPAPPAPRTLSKLQFLRSLTQAERIAFRQAAKANPIMEDFMALLDLAENVDKDDADVVAGLQAAEAAGLIAAGRTAEILA